MKKPTRVISAMSGGVDSSVTTAILVNRGYEVIGVTMRFGIQENKEQRNTSCCSIESVENARMVANQLGISFYAVNYETIFKREIVDYFCNEYSSGRTPNPCIICNEKLKFGKLLTLAKELDAQYVATGHYARILYDSKTGRYILKKGIDRKKDQSYALFSLKQEQLRHILTPLGDYTKAEVRNIAKSLSLKTAQRPESQELCFISDNDYNRFLKESIPELIKPGPIIDKNGKILGQHKGIQFYTIGQRKGLGGNLGKTMYVIKIDADKNTIMVGEKKDLFVERLTAKDTNFISIPKLDKAIRAKAKIRYNDPGSDGIAIPLSSNDKFEFIFDKPCLAVTPGQAVVLYDDEIVIGGGWIEN